MASGQTMAKFSPLHGVPPATNAARLGFRNLHPILKFDPTTAQAIVFSDKLPRSYAGGGLIVHVEWAANGVTTGSVKWSAEIERIQVGTTDLDADSFAAAQEATATAPATDGFTKVTDIPFTHGAQMDSLAAGESYRLRISRVAGDGADDMAADAQLVSVEIEEG